MRSRSSSSVPPSHLHLPFSSTLSFGLCFLLLIPPPCIRNLRWVGYFVTKHSFYTSKKDPASPPLQYDGKPCATCTREPHLKSLFKKWHSYKESERMQGVHFEEQISKIRLPETGVCFSKLLPETKARFENVHT